MSERPRIKADTQHLDELVDRARRGRVRIPTFQRAWKWRADDVHALFDSLWQGFPIGTLLLWKRPARAARLRYGQLEVDAPEGDAWWVIDGQQRLTSLVAALSHPHPEHLPAKDDPFVVWFDPERVTGEPSRSSPFFRPSAQQPVGSGAIPVAGLLDAAAFQAWLFDRVQRTGRRDLVERGTELATRLRNYRVPLYEIETDDAGVAREIFLRMNRTGRRMELAEVFAAMPPASTGEDARPERIVDRLAVGFGRIDPNVVARTAHHLDHDGGTGDVTRWSGQGIDRGDREALMARVEVALNRAIEFVIDAGVPHARLLPQTPTALVTLARFFDRFPAPDPRNLRLLRRWLWRGLLSLTLGSDAKTLAAAVRAVGSDETASVQALLALVPRSTIAPVPATFDARDAGSRLCLLVMALQDPRPAPGTDEGTVAQWLSPDDDAFTFTHWPEASRSPAARFLCASTSPAKWRETLASWAAAADDEALRSHLVDRFDPGVDDQADVFVHKRATALASAMKAVHVARAEPDHDDRPALVVE